MKKKITIPKIGPITALALAAVLILIGALSAFWGFSTKKTISINYSDQSNIDYKVYLKENRFFDTPYLPSGRTYITNLINYLDVDLNYDLTFNEPVDVNYSYYYVATISAAKNNNGTTSGKGEFWTKTYNLTDQVDQSLSGTRNINISQNLKVDYSKYNQILSDFKSTYSLSASGTLKVAMMLSGEIVSDKFEESIPLEYSEVYLSIPLTEQSVEASVVGSTSEMRDHSATRIQNKNNFGRILLRILGVIFIVCGVLACGYAWFAHQEKISAFRYENTVKHLINSYDSIIVEVNERPKTTGTNVLTVNRFDELLDVYNSIHLPISCYRGSKSTDFIIVGDHMTWEYIIKAGDFKKRK